MFAVNVATEDHHEFRTTNVSQTPKMFIIDLSLVIEGRTISFGKGHK